MKRFLRRTELIDADRELLTRLKDALAASGGAEADSDSLPDLCMHLAQAAPRADNTFRRRLESQLAVKLEQRRNSEAANAATARKWPTVRLSASRFKIGLAATCLLVTSLVVAWPVLGQVPGRIIPRRVIPRVAKTLATPIAAGVATPPPAGHWTDLDELQKEAGFTLFVPTYLPAGCTQKENSFNSFAADVILTYSCFSIGEQVGHEAQPDIGEGAKQDITINGQPAIYADGAWFQEPGGKGLVWKSGILHQVMFVRNGIFVRLGAFTTVLGKEELIRIAESLRSR